MLRVMAATGLTVLLAVSAFAQENSGVQVGPSDLLAIQVLDWDPVAGEVRLWEEVSGEYRVGPDGTFSLPFAGRIPGEGRTTNEIAAAIVDALRERLALTAPPDVTVNLAAQRPVIVTGDVRTPGAYDFVPGMLAIEAVGLAGGTGGVLPDEGGYLRDLVALRTSLEVLRSQELRFVARQARLEAELEGRDEIIPEDGTPTDPEWTSVVALEESLMQVRADGLARELAALDDQSELFAAEINALDQRTESLNRQRALADEAATNADDLVERGLVLGGRVIETQNALASIDTQLLDTSTAILRARQNLAQAERERIGLQDLRRSEILQDLQAVSGQLQETRQQIEGQRDAIRAVQAGRPLAVEAEPSISILRRGSDGVTEIEDAELQPLRPGDLVEVRQPIQFTTDLSVEAPPDVEDLPSPEELLGAVEAPADADPGEVEVPDPPEEVPAPEAVAAETGGAEPIVAEQEELPAPEAVAAETSQAEPIVVEQPAPEERVPLPEAAGSSGSAGTPLPGVMPTFNPLGPEPPLRPLVRPDDLE
ncbi:MAG TPA: polysaccharide biosynthesis/export family protein [Rubellimicrobium sp.]|nr:polysaccharide biosynthesis/export family protein [Rubellimicrobium sp.]